MPKRPFKASHLELRHKTYYAVLYVPKDVKHIIGKAKFYKSTQTSSLRVAEQRATALVLGWQAEINRARFQAEDPFITSALSLKEHLARKDVGYLAQEILEEESARLRNKAGNNTLADAFTELAVGIQEPLKAYASEWKKHQENKGLKQKTIDQMKKDIDLLCKTFPTVKSLELQYVEPWIKRVSSLDSLPASASNRILGSCRNFFHYLQSIGAAPKSAATPFIALDEFKISNKPRSRALNKSSSWVPLEPEDLVILFKAALEQEDQILADLILIGAYTGARIEELCSLQISNVYFERNAISIVDAKTKAGDRLVPIHPKIKTRLSEMVSGSTDGFVFSGLTKNKYGDRSNAIGKRFGRLKTKLGFSNSFVFHSIRKTFVTALDNASISENVAADIVGHEKPRITYGLYSGGASLEVKRKAIIKVIFKIP